MFQYKRYSCYYNCSYVFILLCQETSARLEQYVIDHKTYKQNYQTCLDWIEDIRQKLHQCNDVSREQSDVQDRLNKTQVNSMELIMIMGRISHYCINIVTNPQK